ncbi:MAG: DUF6792 domain-containing protein [Methylotenera sp.]
MASTLKQDALLAEFAALAYNPKGEPAPAGWVQIEIEEKGSFAAYAYLNNSEPNEVVIAFRGSDDKGDWVVANKDILAGKWTRQMTQAVEFSAQVEKNVKDKDAISAKKSQHGEQFTESKIYVTGHSLGGALAQVSSQMFGFDGAALDPLAAKKMLNTPEFKDNAAKYTQTVAGKGMSDSFVNYSVVDSAPSHVNGAHIGRAQMIPAKDMSLNDLAKAATVGLIATPPVGIASLIAADQIGNKHSSIPSSQTIRMLAEAAQQDVENHGDLFSGKFRLEAKSSREPRGDHVNFPEERNHNEVLLRGEDGVTKAVLRFHGGIDDRQLEVLSPDGNTRLLENSIHDPKINQVVTTPQQHEAENDSPQTATFSQATQDKIVAAFIQQNIRTALERGEHVPHEGVLNCV